MQKFVMGTFKGRNFLNEKNFDKILQRLYLFFNFISGIRVMRQMQRCRSSVYHLFRAIETFETK